MNSSQPIMTLLVWWLQHWNCAAHFRYRGNIEYRDTWDGIPACFPACNLCWEFVYLVCGLSPPKLRIVRCRNLHTHAWQPCACRTCSGFYVYSSVVRYPRYLDTYHRYLRDDTSIANVTIYRGIP